jgi:hypothetical protein
MYYRDFCYNAVVLVRPRVVEKHPVKVRSYQKDLVHHTTALVTETSDTLMRTSALRK